MVKLCRKDEVQIISGLLTTTLVGIDEGEIRY